MIIAKCCKAEPLNLITQMSLLVGCKAFYQPCKRQRLLLVIFPDIPSGQGDKTGTMLSDGAIYSSIDFTTKANYNSPGQTSQATPYATTQILHSSSIHELAVDLPEAQWKTSLQAKQEMANLGYSLPDKNSCNNSEWPLRFATSPFRECVSS